MDVLPPTGLLWMHYSGLSGGCLDSCGCTTTLLDYCGCTTQMKNWRETITGVSQAGDAPHRDQEPLLLLRAVLSHGLILHCSLHHSSAPLLQIPATTINICKHEVKQYEVKVTFWLFHQFPTIIVYVSQLSASVLQRRWWGETRLFVY